MNMMDDATLSEALHGRADDFEVSPEAIERIVRAARESEVEAPRPSVVTHFREHRGARRALAAAAIVVVVAALSTPLVRDEGSTVHSGASGTSVDRLAAGSFSVGLSVGLSGDQSSEVQGASSLVSSTTSTSSQSLKIESRGDVDLTVPDGAVKTSLRRMTTLAQRDAGFVESTSANATTRSHDYTSATIVLQVPQRLFATLVTQVDAVGTATSVDVSSNDVTSQYVGLSARINALQASRQQYLTIMSHATSIGDILAVQTQLNSLQSQIEQLQGQMTLLNGEITYGSLTVQVTAAGHVVAAPSKSGFAKAWHQSVAGFVDGVEWLIRIIGPVLFVVLALGALILALRAGRRAIVRRRA